MSDAALAWVARREPAAPPALAEHVAAALGTLPPSTVERDDELSAVVRACVDAAEATLVRVLVDGAVARAAALDLLAADALVTYAFEAASERPDDLPAAAREAMARLSRAAAAVPAT